MNLDAIVHPIAGHLSLREPQADSLRKLANALVTGVGSRKKKGPDWDPFCCVARPERFELPTP